LENSWNIHEYFCRRAPNRVHSNKIEYCKFRLQKSFTSCNNPIPTTAFVAAFNSPVISKNTRKSYTFLLCSTALYKYALSPPDLYKQEKPWNNQLEVDGQPKNLKN
jgi:hypothetical protein